ncbi:MAG: nuclear transport factor 2 family protein [Chromatiaceae bacterium]|jgi:steroid delta-isomerase|nr:nuclear transport factor 2 family protein [Chromatiaceae bacterium]
MTAVHVRRYVDFFERLQPASLESLGDHFSEAARFTDPFNDVRGHAAIRAVFAHMFATCERPQFAVDEAVDNGRTAYLRWRFSFGQDDARRHIEGVSRVLFDTDGRALEHIDYWDPARQLYEHIPVLGSLFRVLRRRLGTPPRTRGQATADIQARTSR